MHSQIVVRTITSAFIGVFLAGIPAVAQQPMPHDVHPDPRRHVTPRRAPAADTARQHEPSGPLGISMDRMGSGTTWIPDAVSLPARHMVMGRWNVMLHGIVFAQYDKQGGPRGNDQLGSLNWTMLMVSRDVAGGRFQARTMLSLDAATVTARGYPLLLQTGEGYQGQPLHDRQHPHDFWMELGVLYERPLTSFLGVSLYAAPSGEPALGPVAFMHRPSAMDDPVAPLSHHWQDATHISFGVLTVGLFGRRWKLEGSAFNGREPDDKRWNFDRLRLDSYSGRLTVNPSDHFSVAVGYGYLKSPEALRATESVHRTTASLLYGRKLGADGQLATAVVWGANLRSGQRTSGILAEGEAVMDRHNTLFGRIERVEKSAEELVLPTGPGGVTPRSTFDISSLSLGFIREIVRTSGATIGLGIRGTADLLPDGLTPYYGSRTPVGGVVFVRLRPLHHVMSLPGMPGMSMPGHE